MTGILEGKCALVTGGASGIGRAAALAMAREGARVAVADRTEEMAAARREPSTSLWRRAMTSAYDPTTRIVSSSDSPIITEENSCARSVEMTLPPRRCIADSNEKRVRVEGS